MTTVPGGETRYNFMVPSDPESVIYGDEVKQDMLTNPLRIAEMAIEIQVEKIRVTEAMNARDALVQKLSDAYTSIREKTELIERLQQLTGHRAQITDLEALIQDLRLTSRTAIGPPPKYEEEERKNELPGNPDSNIQTTSVAISPLKTDAAVQATLAAHHQERSVQTSVAEELEDMVNARFAILASIPLPDTPPDDTLQPIVLPPACTLHEFLGTTSGTLRNSLGNYRVLQSLTTKWCPNREEHGYSYSPLFKCSTNPRVTTAHRWQPVDVTARMKNPTECFYNREGLWYYAGSYQAFRLEDLTAKEWAELPTETANYLVKETISGRKNVSPQNVYEINQLYNAGALKIACVGLQCVGFNQDVYKSILDHASKFTQAKWKAMSSTGTPTANVTNGTTICGNGASGNRSTSTSVKSPPVGISRPVSPTSLGPTSIGFGAVAAGLGLGNGTSWNTTAAVLAQGGNQMVLPAHGNENMQPTDAATVAYRGGLKK